MGDCFECTKADEFMRNATKRVIIQEKRTVSDNYGGNTVTWVDTGKYYGYLIPASGNEVFRSEQLQSRVTHKVVIRFQRSFSNTKDFAAKRILFQNRIFNIRYIRNLDEAMKYEGEVFQEISAEENAAEVENG